MAPSSLEVFLQREILLALDRAGLPPPETVPPLQQPPPSLHGVHLTSALPLALAPTSPRPAAELAVLLRSHLCRDPRYTCGITPHHWLTFTLGTDLMTTHLTHLWHQEEPGLVYDAAAHLWLGTAAPPTAPPTDGVMEYVHASCCRLLRLGQRLAVPHPWQGPWQLADPHPQAIALALVLLLGPRRSPHLPAVALAFLNTCPWIHEPTAIAQSRLGLIALTQKALAREAGAKLKNFCEL